MKLFANSKFVDRSMIKTAGGVTDGASGHEVSTQRYNYVKKKIINEKSNLMKRSKNIN